MAKNGLAGLFLLTTGIIYFVLSEFLGFGGISCWILSPFLAGAAVVFVFQHMGTEKRVDPTNKAVVITGCDSGFGYSLAMRLDGAGFKVFAGCLMSDREGARSLQKECSHNLQVLQLDITDDWQVRQAVKQVKQDLGDNQLWALVNNAGIAVFSEIEWCSVSQYQRIMDVNVIGLVRVTKSFLPLIRKTPGRVVNVASLAGRFTYASFSAYSMSKFANIAFSDGLRREMAKFDVKVITIEPGLYRTPISSEEVLIDMNRKSWSETPTEIKESYGEEYFDAFLQNIKMHLNQARSNVEEVVDMMVHSVVMETPHRRYVPYWKTYWRSTVLMMLPSSLLDRVFKLYGVDADPAEHYHSQEQ